MTQRNNIKPTANQIYEYGYLWAVRKWKAINTVTNEQTETYYALRDEGMRHTDALHAAMQPTTEGI